MRDKRMPISRFLRTARYARPGIPSMLGFIATVFLLSMTTTAQEAECLKIWEPWRGGTPYAVNVDTGVVTELQPSTPTPSPPAGLSPDGRYTAELDWQHNNRKLRLVDNDRGVSAILDEYVSATAWSPDSTRLAFIHTSSDAVGAFLKVVTVDGSNLASITLSDDLFLGDSNLAWSPDGTVIMGAVVREFAPEAWDLYVLSAADLTLKNTLSTSLIYPHYLWSPSGQFLLAHGSNETAYLMNIQSGSTVSFAVFNNGNNRFTWSPDGQYLLITHAQNDWLDVFNVVDMQGKLLLENVVVDTNYDSSRSQVEWEVDNQLIASFNHVEIAVSDLIEFSLPGGQHHVLQPNLSGFRLSPDKRYAAVADGTQHDVIQFFDLSSSQAALERTLTPDGGYANLIWRRDGLELLVLFDDRRLRAYDYAADTWRDITTIPGEVAVLEHIRCAN